LEEISEADLLIHVVDSTHPQASAQAETVYRTLKALEITHIPMVTALNKSDSLPPNLDLSAGPDLRRSVLISALRKTGLDELLRAIDETFRETMIPIRVHLPYQQGKLINLLHTEGFVEKILHRENGMIITGWIHPAYWSDFEPYLRNERGTK
jgi:GTP-binding protein HflX